MDPITLNADMDRACHGETPLRTTEAAKILAELGKKCQTAPPDFFEYPKRGVSLRLQGDVEEDADYRSWIVALKWRL